MGVPYKMIIELYLSTTIMRSWLARIDCWCYHKDTKTDTTHSEEDIDPERDRAVRTFAWEHSLENGFDWHWVMDDNIDGFRRFNNDKNMQGLVQKGFIFKMAEKFVSRYTNIGQAGFHYDKFVTTKNTYHTHEYPNI